MLTSLYTSYLDSERTNFNESELNPLIIKVYQIISSILKSKYESENYNVKQIEEEAIEFTAHLCKKDISGIPVLIVNLKKDIDTLESELDFEYKLYERIKSSINYYKKII